MARADFTSKDLWLAVKPLVRTHQKDDSYLAFDDYIIEKPYTDENELVSWHWNHSKGRTVKGINLLSAFYYTQKDDTSQTLCVPVAIEIIKKTITFSKLKIKKVKRTSDLTKNELLR